MREALVVVVSVAVPCSIVGVLAYVPFVVRRKVELRRRLRGLLGRANERIRLRIAAVLLDLGSYLMLCDEERRARRLGKRLSGRRTKRLGLKAAALRLGAKRADEVTLEIPVGSREQEGNPSRTLVLSCVVHHPPPGEYRTAEGFRRGGGCTRSWRVVNRPSPGYRGPSTMCEVPSLERALVAYHARALRPERGGRFFDEGVHHDAGKPGGDERAHRPVEEEMEGADRPSSRI